MSRATLSLAGLIAMAIGFGMLTVPHLFYASYGLELGVEPSLLSEIRAPGGLILVIAVVLCRGALFEAHRTSAAWLGAAFYSSYAAARLLSILLDGLPHPNLLYAGAAELTLGLACAWVYRCARPSNGRHLQCGPEAAGRAT